MIERLREPAAIEGVTGPRAREARVRPTADCDPLSSVFQDLQVPLASVVMGAGFLRRALVGDDKAALRIVDAMRRAAVRMDQVIVSRSDLAKLERHELTLEIRPRGLGAILRTAFEQILPEAAAEDIPVSLELDPDALALRVPVDRTRFLQILAHLATCALRVVPEGGSIIMCAGSKTSAAVQIGIEAKGAEGADSHPLWRDLPRPQLAVAQELIELHGGRLTVVDDGGTFTLSFSLPLV